MKRIAIFLAAVQLLAGRAHAWENIRFLDPIKVPKMQQPVAAASSGERLYVIDRKASSLLVLDADGKLVASIGGPGSKPGQFKQPHGVALGPDGDVYVADTGNNRVQIFDGAGKFIDAFGESGSEPGHLDGPMSVAVGADGRIFVADTGNDRIQVFTRQGILLYVLGRGGKEPGQFKNPQRVVVDPSDELYVLDEGNERVQKFDASAKFIKAYPLIGDDIAADAYGFLYTIDGRHGKVLEQFDGQLRGRVGASGKGVGQFRSAEGIAVAPDGSLIVLDTGNDRIQRLLLTNKLKTTPLPLNASTKMSVSGPTATWKYAATQIAAYGDSLYAYMPQGGPFVLIGPDGKQKAAFGTTKGKDGSATRSAGGIAAGAKGLVASDTPDSRLQRFSLEGKWQSNVGEAEGFFDSKSKEGRVRQPSGVAINDDGTIYAADTGNHRIDVFSPEGVFLTAIGPNLGSYILSAATSSASPSPSFGTRPASSISSTKEFTAYSSASLRALTSRAGGKRATAQASSRRRSRSRSTDRATSIPSTRS
jgi:DNA-binding beta-propeller fold protein YncE